jgi:hypothetical protein
LRTMVPLRPQALAIVISVAAPFACAVAVAEPLDKESCANLQAERKKLFNRDMQAALDQGPDWVKGHLNDEAIDKVRRFLSVDEQIRFRCRGGGAAKPAEKSTGSVPQGSQNATTVPLPERKPTPPQPQAVTGSLAKP